MAPGYVAVIMLRAGVALAALALVAAACADSRGGPAPLAPPATEEDPVTTSSSAPDEGSGGAVLPAGPSALDDMFSAEFPEPLVDPTEIISGGPPPDGIPPLDFPTFVSIAEADEYLADAEAVVALEVDGDARAYPVQILVWHEIVNDEVGGIPVSITYCPLCNSAVSYVRQVRGVTTTFGTSGRLFASALVMYDRATESLWTHFDGKAVVGVLAGDELEVVGSPLVAWSDFKEGYPDGVVLDRETTGFPRDYGRNPYVGYDDPDTDPFLFRGDLDERARAKQRVVGVEVDGQSKAWTLQAISGGEASATQGQVGGRDLIILWSAGQATALESNVPAEGRDVGSAGVFVPEVEGQMLTISADAAGVFTDVETGSEWNVLGQAIAGPLAGSSLERIPHLDTFWFAWSTYQPDTEFIEAP